MSPVQLGAALAALIGALLAISARDTRWALGGLLAAAGFAALIADPLPAPLAIGVRLVAAALGVDLILLVIRPATTQGPVPAIGPIAPGLAAAALLIVGYAASGVGSPAVGPPVATASGLGLAAIAVGPLLFGRDLVRLGIGATLAVIAAGLVRAGLAGTSGDLEQIVMGALTLAVLGATAALAWGALRSGAGLTLGNGLPRETLFEAHPLAVVRVGSPNPRPGPGGRATRSRAPGAAPRRDGAAHQLTIEERLRISAPPDDAPE